jgi:hypothetical protein
MAEFRKLPGIPSITPVKDATVAAILRPIKESIEILGSAVTGTPLASGEVIDSGLSIGSGTGSGAGYDPFVDFTPPQTPTNFSVTGAFNNILMSWDEPTYQNHSYTEIWRSTTNALGGAVLIGFSPGAVFSDVVSNNTTYYYWIRFVSKAGVEGPYNAFSGTLGVTALDPDYLIDVLASSDPDAIFFKVTTPTVINGVTIQPGVYIKQAVIADATISRAKIQDLAVDSAKIADAAIVNAKIANASITTAKIDDAQITAAKIVDATITNAKIANAAINEAKIADASITNAKIAENIQSNDFSAGTAGWRIQKSGNAEFNNAVFRGTLDVKSASSGGRLEITNQYLRVYDDAGVLRVQLGVL